MTPDMLVLSIGVYKVKKYDDKEVEKLLMNEDFSLPHRSGVYPIHEICAAPYNLVDFAIARGANVNVRDSEGYTPLDIAISRGDELNVDALIRNGADIEERDRYGNNPLLSAVLRGPAGYGMVEKLLKSGADPDVKNMNGKSARDIMQDIKHPLLSKLR